MGDRSDLRASRLVPRHRGMERLRLGGLEQGEGGCRDEQLDGSRDPGSSADELATLKLQDHLVDRRRSYPEEGLHVGLRGRPTVEDRVGIDEGKVLALFLSVVRAQGIPIAARS
jgi:hypothetical protein